MGKIIYSVMLLSIYVTANTQAIMFQEHEGERGPSSLLTVQKAQTVTWILLFLQHIASARSPLHCLIAKRAIATKRIHNCPWDYMFWTCRHSQHVNSM